MNAFDKVKVRSSEHPFITIPLDCRHTTTSDFFQFNIAYIRRMIPKEKHSVDVSTFSRLAGMPLPTFGDANLNLRAFFVPYRCVFPGWLDFYEGTPHPNADGSNQMLSRPPFFKNADLVAALMTSPYSTEIQVPTGQTEPSAGSYDFCYIDSTGNTVKWYKFSADGRFVYKILRQLGYAPNFDIQSANSANYIDLNALDLLCWVKCYIDYYFPTQYYHVSSRLQLESLCKYDTGVLQLTQTNLTTIFQYCTLVAYANDFFTSAFDNPVGPTSGAESSIYIRDNTASDTSSYVLGVDSGYTSSQGSNNGTPTIHQFQKSNDASATNVSFYRLSEYAQMALRKLTDYVKRHQLLGSSAVSRFLGQFGIKMDNDKANRCYYLGSHHIPLVVADVMSNSDTFVPASGGNPASGAALGDYAGKGFLTGNNGHFECESGVDYGLFLIVATIVPRVAYYQGYDKDTLNASRLDFYDGTFDGFGTRAIEKGELFMTMDPNNVANCAKVRNAFAFTPMYAEKKIPYDRLTGDFNLASLNAAGFTSDAWNLFREISTYDYDSIVHNLNFVLGRDWMQYLRIFYNNNTDADHFVINYLFNAKSTLPVKPLYDSYEFEHEDGQDILAAPNGNRVN